VAGLALAPVEEPDVEVVNGLVPCPGRHVVMTVVGEDVSLDDPHLTAQLGWSQAIVAASARVAGELRARGAPAERLHIASDSLEVALAVARHPDEPALELQARLI
jgi:hypothetical protein